MAKKRQGAPKKPSNQVKDSLIQIRASADEKAAFVHAAELSGLALSQWIRSKLRAAAIADHAAAGESAPFASSARSSKKRPKNA